MIKTFQKIYARMYDQLSKEIYIDRLNYSVTREYSYLERMVDRTVRGSRKWKIFLEELKDRAQVENMYLFGAGVWGNILYEETKAEIQWQGVIDNQPNGKAIADFDIKTLEQFMKQCDNNASVVVSSYKNGIEMSKQLLEQGFNPDRILDAGKVIYALTEGAIYFELEELGPQDEGEYFVDAGGFDGLTTMAFFNWCKGKGYSYCFEADQKNVEVIESRLRGCENCEIISKALWSETTSLSMKMEGSCGSAVMDKRIGEGIQEVKAVSLDDILGDKRVTFIKMDIEGAELEALRGAKYIIQKQHPKLAISIYHKYEDIWTIPSLIMEYYSGYKFYLRHYSFSNYDTVMYALPRYNKCIKES